MSDASAGTRPLRALEGVRALVTGNTGFKGSWLTRWLTKNGAEVHGLGLEPPAQGAFHELDVASVCAMQHHVDIRDADAVDRAVRESVPDVVFHLAAQPIVIEGWRDRRTTYATNVMGTVHVVEAALACDRTRAVVVATTDKVYRNLGDGTRFREGDELGGHDPYSASKAAAELALAPYRTPEHMGLRDVPLVAARAGNVIGGGDWSADRLVPDIVRALVTGERVVLRHPDATRPWQHVLDCLWGYLLVAAHALAGRHVAPAYNFARGDEPRRVVDVARQVIALWGVECTALDVEPGPAGREAPLLDLDATLARRDLGWEPAWSFDEMLDRTVAFYRAAPDDRAQLGRQHLDEYQARAEQRIAAVPR